MSNPNIANPVATPTVSGSVTVDAVLGSCNFTKDIWLEIIDPQINVTAQGITNICQGESVQLIANNNTNGSGINWSPFLGLNDPFAEMVSASPNQTTTYTATLNIEGCSVSDNITVTVDPFSMPVLVTTDTVLCEGQSLELANAIPGSLTDYNWSPTTGLSNPNISNPIATPTSNTVYTLTATSPNNFCSQTATVNIEVVPASLEIEGDDFIQLCLGETVDLTANTSTNGVGLTWSPDSTLSSPTATTVTASPDQTTLYIAELIVGGCTLYDTVTVRVDSLPSTTAIDIIPEKDSYCLDEVVSFISPSIDIGFFPDIEFLWTPDDGSFISEADNFNLVISTQQSATYTRTITNGTCSNSESVSIIVNDPQVSLNTSEIEGCQGETFDLVASGTDTYSWSPGNGLDCTDCPNPTYTINGDGMLTVIGDIAGCTDMLTIPVILSPSPNCESLTISPMDSITVGQEVELTVVHSGGATSTIEWNYNGLPTGLSGETVTINANEVSNDFNAVVTNEFGCSCSISLNEVEAIEPINELPNVFTPDNDGNNDFFNVVFVPNQGNIQVRNLRVYNRWGEMVYERRNFEPNNPSLGWDGFFDRKRMKPAIFIYRAEVEMICLLYTSPSPRDATLSRMPSSA